MGAAKYFWLVYTRHGLVIGEGDDTESKVGQAGHYKIPSFAFLTSMTSIHSKLRSNFWIPQFHIATGVTSK